MRADSIIKNALILCGITLVAGILLGLTYNVTKQPIQEQEKLQLDNALNMVLENAHFSEVEKQSESKAITNVYQAKRQEEVIGYAFQLETTEGYGDKIRLVVGLSQGRITGIDIVKQAETPGLGAESDQPTFKNQFIGKAIELLNLVKGEGTAAQDIDAISGATITSRAVTNAVNEAISYYNQYLKEGNQ